ncbi:MAG TPA: hemerythrin domain-containing protein [Alphaproteobacteria bacterium]|nr:hemerythrin domain-containing protein [Alphaproteobacteria bacterium]
MTAEITKLDSPIDVMYLIHKALRAEAARVEHMCARLAVGNSLQPFQEVFQRWGKALAYHAHAEDRYMTAPLVDSPPARDNEATHRALEERLADIQTYAKDEVGSSLMSAKVHRHLFGKVVALRIAQDDHFEEEEAFVLPLIRQRISEAQQLEMARRLLIDVDEPDSGWIMDSVAEDLTPAERQLLADVVARFKAIPGEARSR